MSSRLDIELTSQRPDGTWTWRKAGARQPKGELNSTILPDSVSVGDVLRAEVDVLIDGIDVLSVLPAKQARDAKDGTLELLGSGRTEELVTTKLVGKGGGRGRDRDGGSGGRGRRSEGGRGGGGRDRKDRGDRGDRRPDGDRGKGGRDRSKPRSEPPRLKRLRPGRAHRTAVLDALPAEQRPIAEQVLKGGVPAVRQAVDKQNEQNRSRGEAEIKGDELVSMAERMLPALRSAEWLDRAEAALAAVADLDLRDLRSVVVAAESGARDDESRALADDLREKLVRRVEEEHSLWLTELTQAVRDGRTVRALRLSSRPPKAGAPLPAELTETLISQATESLASDTSPDRWVTVIDALAFSPVRASVTPASIPETVTDDMKQAVSKAATRLSHIAALMGIEAAPRKPRSPKKSTTSGKRRGGTSTPRSSAAPKADVAPSEKAPDTPKSVDETKPEVAPEPVVETKPEVAPEPVVETKPEVAPEPVVETKPEVAPEPVVETKPEVAPEPSENVAE